MSTLAKVLAGAAPVIAVLVAAAFLAPPALPYLARQLLLFACGVGGIFLAERLLFGSKPKQALSAMGFVSPAPRAVAVAILVSAPMWLFLPAYGALIGKPASVSESWAVLLLGVVLVNGIAEEVIHRAFVFGHLRRDRSFLRAAAISAAIFALQHVYLMLTIGAVPGAASILLALALGLPLAFLYERGGNSLAAPAILHTSSNAPMMLFATSDLVEAAILPHMAVVLASMYAVFAFARWLGEPAPAAGTPR